MRPRAQNTTAAVMTAVCAYSAALCVRPWPSARATKRVILPATPKSASRPTEVVARTTDQMPTASIPMVRTRNRYRKKSTPADATIWRAANFALLAIWPFLTAPSLSSGRSWKLARLTRFASRPVPVQLVARHDIPPPSLPHAHRLVRGHTPAAVADASALEELRAAHADRRYRGRSQYPAAPPRVSLRGRPPGAVLARHAGRQCAGGVGSAGQRAVRSRSAHLGYRAATGRASRLSRGGSGQRRAAAQGNKGERELSDG